MLSSSKLIVSITDGNRKIVILPYTTVKSLFENQVIVNSARGVGGRRNKNYTKMRLGKRHVEVAARWLPSAIIYGGGSSLALVYFTDWKLIAANIPFYGGKFK